MAGFNHKLKTMANIIDGRKLSEDIKNKIIEDKRFLPLNPESFVGIIQFGENASSDIYIRNKIKFGEGLNIKVKLFKFGYKEDTNEDPKSFDEIKKKIEELNNDKNCLGMIIQAPLPSKFTYDITELCDIINPLKDLDAMSSVNLGRISNNSTLVLPATVKAVVKILDQIANKESHNNTVDFLRGKNIVVINNSIILGKPLASYLLNHEATVTVCHSHTKDLSYHTVDSDIVITGTGVKGLIKTDMIKEGAIVIDCGITKDPNNTDPTKANKIYGDVEYEEIEKKASYITPVPGGVGPMTVACLFDNLFDLNLKK